MTKARLVTIVGLLFLTIFIGASIISKNFTTSEGYSDEKLLQEIIDTFPEFTAEGKPVIAVESVSRPEKQWYVVTIKSLQPVDNFVPVKVVLFGEEDDSQSLSVVLGPDVHFSKRETLAFSLPESVIIDIEE